MQTVDKSANEPFNDAGLERRSADSRGYFDMLRAAGLAPVVRNAVKNDTFLDITVEGRRFKAVELPTGPAIHENGKHAMCPLGATSIRRIHMEGAERWWIVAGPELLVYDVSGMTDHGRRSLAVEFGLPIEPEESHLLLDLDRVFYSAQAFEALRSWAGLHPVTIRNYRGNGVLGDWPSFAAPPKRCA